MTIFKISRNSAFVNNFDHSTIQFNDPFNSLMIIKFSRIIDVLDKPLKIADMGCGFGNSSLALASIFPQATVHGLDIDGDSILKAKANIASLLSLVTTTLLSKF